MEKIDAVMSRITPRGLFVTGAIWSLGQAAIVEMPPIGRVMCVGCALVFAVMAIWPPKAAT